MSPVTAARQQATHTRRAGRHLNAAQRTAMRGKPLYCVYCVQGESSKNIGESFYRSVVIDSAVGFMTSDGSGFFLFTSVQQASN